MEVEPIIGKFSYSDSSCIFNLAVASNCFLC